METVSRESVRFGTFAGVVAVLVGVGSAMAPGPMLISIAITASLVLFITRPETLLYGTLIAALLTSPAAFPTTFKVTVGPLPFQFYLFEPLLFASLTYVLVNYRLGRVVSSRALVTLGIFGAGAVLGIATGYGFQAVFGDMRGPLNMVFAAIVAAGVARTEIVGRTWNVMLIVLWISAVTTLLSSVLGISVRGDELATAGVATDAGGTARILSPATYPALAVVCGSVGLAVAGRSKLGPLIPWLLPSLLIVLLSFARNSVIAISVAVIFGLIAGGLHRTIWRAAGYGLGAAVGLLMVWLTAKAAQTTAVGVWAVGQFEFMFEKVFEGILPGSLGTDPSAQYRLTEETPYLLEGIRRAPLFGHGFGFPYRPLTSFGYVIIEYGEALRYYAHNFYLWLVVKAGVVGLVLFTWSFILPVLRCWPGGSRAALGAAAAAAGLLAVSVVSPMPLGPATSIVLGTLVGFCWGNLDSRLMARGALGQDSRS